MAQLTAGQALADRGYMGVQEHRDFIEAVRLTVTNTETKQRMANIIELTPVTSRGTARVRGEALERLVEQHMAVAS